MGLPYKSTGISPGKGFNTLIKNMYDKLFLLLITTYFRK